MNNDNTKDIIGKLFPTSESENVLNQEYQWSEWKFTCCFCDYDTNDKKTYDAHSFENHGSINCDHCEYSALDKGLMKKHMKKHTGRFIFTCGICEFEATKQSFLENHVELKHKKKDIDTESHKCEKVMQFLIEYFS